MADENILKIFYHIGESDANFTAPRTASDLLGFRKMNSASLQSGLKRLARQGLVNCENRQWQLTPSGFERAKKVVRLHRLWELYLSDFMAIAPDHVHDNADTMEHFITPEIEAQLEKYLSNPQKDPHGTVIPK